MNVTVKQIDSARHLMERVLRDGDPIAAEYPLVFEDGFPGRIVALSEGDDVRSACAILVRDFLVDGTRIRGGMIGSVSTDPEWRGHGLATRILLEAEVALQREGCAFGVLWADDADFYVKRGYGPIGTEEDFVLPAGLACELPAATGVRAMTAADAPSIHALYARHPVRVERSPEETAALLGCPRMETLVLERDGEVVAYACRGRGRDLTDAIHEWSGQTEDVLGLIRSHLERRFPEGSDPAGTSGDSDGRLFFMAPPGATELCERLATLGAETSHGMLGLGKLLDREAALELCRERLGPEGSAELVACDDGRPFHLVGPKGEGTLDDEGMLALLLGVCEVKEDVLACLEGMGLEDARLPIEPFAWGLDSI